MFALKRKKKTPIGADDKLKTLKRSKMRTNMEEHGNALLLNLKKTITAAVVLLAVVLSASTANAVPTAQDDTIMQAGANHTGLPCCVEITTATVKKSALIATHISNLNIEPIVADVPMNMARSSKESIQLADRAMDMRFRDKEASAFRAAAFKKNMEADLYSSDLQIHSDFGKWWIAAYFSHMIQTNAMDASIDMLLLAPTMKTSFQNQLELELKNADQRIDQTLLMSFYGKLNQSILEQADQDMDALFQSNYLIP